MNLVFLYQQTGIEGIDLDTLAYQLSHGTIRSNRGILITNDNKIIKCVEEYYARPNMPPIKKMANKCYYVQNALGITNIGAFQCTQCHAACINMKKTHRLYRK